MDKFEIGGRTFQLAGEGTARKDMFTMRQIAACGVNVIRQSDNETEQQFQYRLYTTALQTGDFFLLLGSLLVPDQTDPLAWSEKMASETAEFLGKLTQPEDKAKLRILLASALMPFFVSGRRSSQTFQRYSTQLESGRAHTGSVDTESTETGVSSSAKLPDGITTASSSS